MTEAPFVKFMVSFSPSYLNNICKIYDNNFFYRDLFKNSSFFLPFYIWAGEQYDSLEILLHV